VKLERLALVAEIISSIAIVVTLIVLVIEVRDNTSAVRAETRQSIAARVERITMTVATDDELADLIEASEAGNLAAVDDLRFAAFITAVLTNAEEAYLQVQDGRLEEEYFDARLQGIIGFLSTGAGAVVYARHKSQRMYVQAFTDVVDRAIVDQSGR